MVTFANLGSVRLPIEVRRPSRSEDTAHLACQLSISASVALPMALYKYVL